MKQECTISLIQPIKHLWKTSEKETASKEFLTICQKSQICSKRLLERQPQYYRKLIALQTYIRTNFTIDPLLVINGSEPIGAWDVYATMVFNLQKVSFSPHFQIYQMTYWAFASSDIHESFGFVWQYLQRLNTFLSSVIDGRSIFVNI